MGETQGGYLKPAVATDLPNTPPICDGPIEQTDSSNLPDWAVPSEYEQEEFIL